jgi:pantoate--beta-alanine ligase
MSSRNGYLTPQQKTEAARLNASLKEIVTKIQHGNTDFATLEQTTAQALNNNHWQVDYISIRSARTLLPASAQDTQLVVLAAAKIGNTRLIDNIEFATNTNN